jgi:2-C-methyl-D-erythritol 4-phosphate cytidylyltransferase
MCTPAPASSSRFAVLLPAAGSGSRFNASRGAATPIAQNAAESGGGAADKLLHDVRGKSVLRRAVALFATRNDVDIVLIVTSPDRFDAYRDHLCHDIDPAKLHFTPGGRERWESVLLGLRHLASLPNAPAYVAIHDAARPLTPAHVIDEAFRTTVGRGAALPAVPEPATLKRRSRDGTVADTVPRADLFQAQTPQCFDFAKLLAAYEALLAQNLLADVTDDAQVFERASLPVPITSGSPLNLKITTPEDLALARALLA